MEYKCKFCGKDIELEGADNNEVWMLYDPKWTPETRDDVAHVECAKKFVMEHIHESLDLWGYHGYPTGDELAEMLAKKTSEFMASYGEEEARKYWRKNIPEDVKRHPRKYAHWLKWLNGGEETCTEKKCSNCLHYDVTGSCFFHNLTAPNWVCNLWIPRGE